MLLNEMLKIVLLQILLCHLLTSTTSGLYILWFTKIAEAPVLCFGYVAVSFKGTLSSAFFLLGYIGYFNIFKCFLLVS